MHSGEGEVVSPPSFEVDCQTKLRLVTMSPRYLMVTSGKSHHFHMSALSISIRKVERTPNSNSVRSPPLSRQYYSCQTRIAEHKGIGIGLQIQRDGTFDQEEQHRNDLHSKRHLQQ